MKHYLLLWLGLTCALILGVATFNLVVDPYDLFHLVNKPGLNQIKPKAGVHGSMTKAYQALRIQPRGLILGNSRAEIGFDPEYSAWPENARPIFNMALPGTGTRTSLRYLQHVLAKAEDNQAKPKVVVWGIDLMDFLVNANVRRTAGVLGRNDLRLLVNPDGSRNAARPLYQLKDYTESTLTLNAFLDSLQTVFNQDNTYSEDLTPLGFNPMHDYRKIAAEEGYWALFRQRDIENIKSYSRRPKGIIDTSRHSSPPLEDLREVIRLCHQHGIALQLVIYPYHANLLEVMRITDHWQSFEDWKRAVVQIADGESRSTGKAPVTVWDFSGFNSYTTEAIPAKGDKKAHMHWYWEAGHFKRELGDLMLTRIFGRSSAIDGFGVLLNAANIEQQIASLKTQESTYRQSHAERLEELACLAKQVGAADHSRPAC